MLLPDNYYDYWDSVADISMNTEFNPEQWLRMEKIGAVFLPNAGYCQSGSYHENGKNYWTSSASTTPSGISSFTSPSSGHLILSSIQFFSITLY